MTVFGLGDLAFLGAVGGVSAPPLLDQFTGAAAAYSLRQLRTGVTNVVRVRRSSDNIEEDFTAAQVIDGTLTMFCGAGNGFVRTWYDQSGNSYHAQQTTTANQPQIISSGSLITKNSKPAISMDGSGDTLTASITPLLTYGNMTVFAVNNPANASAADTNTQTLFGIQSGGASGTSLPGLSYGPGSGAISGEHIGMFFASSAIGAGRLGSSTYSHSADAQLLHSTFWLSSGFSAYKNGGIISMNLASDMTTGTPCAPSNTNATVPNFHIGTISGSGGMLQKFQEIIVYPSNQIANRTAIESNINAHYGIY